MNFAWSTGQHRESRNRMTHQSFEACSVLSWMCSFVPGTYLFPSLSSTYIWDPVYVWTIVHKISVFTFLACWIDNCQEKGALNLFVITSNGFMRAYAGSPSYQSWLGFCFFLLFSFLLVIFFSNKDDIRRCISASDCDWKPMTNNQSVCWETAQIEVGFGFAGLVVILTSRSLEVSVHC